MFNTYHNQSYYSTKEGDRDKMNRSMHCHTKSLAKPEVHIPDSPVVMLNKELKFDTEESKAEKEDIMDLNTLLQFNEGHKAEIDAQADAVLDQVKESSLLKRHKDVKKDILNLPRPAPPPPKSILTNLQSLDEPILINNHKLYEPFYPHCWEALKTVPLTTLKLKLSKGEIIEKVLNGCTEILRQSIKEEENMNSSKLRALQLRLVRILYKRKLYPLVLRLQETIYEYHDKAVNLSQAHKTWKQTVDYTRRVHGDKSLISKVRQNKAFEMRRQMNISNYGKKVQEATKSKYEEREQEAELSYTLAKEIAHKMLIKCCFLSLRLNSKVNKAIRILVEEVRGATKLKRAVFEEFKILGFKRAEQNRVAKTALQRMQKWRLFMCFKSWQDIKTYEAKEQEKEQKAVELLNKRRKLRLFNYLKIGVVYNRISYLNHQIVDIVYWNSLQMKVLVEWRRRVHVDKSIKSKVIQMLNKSSTSLNSKFVNMNKLQIEEYFNTLRKEGLERVSEDLVTLKLEREHYKSFIKNEILEIKRKVDNKHPLKLHLDTKTFFEKMVKKNSFEGETYKAARDYLFMTPEKVRNKTKNQRKIQPNGFVELLKSNSRRQNSCDKSMSDVFNPRKSTELYTDLEKSLAEKEMIHRSFHNFKEKTMLTNSSPYRPSHQPQEHPLQPYIDLKNHKTTSIQGLQTPKATSRSTSNLNSFPKPLPSRILTPRGAPNDLFRKLETKLKASKGDSESEGCVVQNRILTSKEIVEKVIDPELKIKEHIKTLLTSMRALRDVPNDYFRKSYFLKTTSQVDPKESLGSLEDILREGRRANPEMKVSHLFNNIHGSKITSICFTQWKIAFIQKWIIKDMAMLQKYKRGKQALSAMKIYLKQRKSNMQEFQVKREILLQIRCLKAWKSYEEYPAKLYRASKIFYGWRNVSQNLAQERIKIQMSFDFRDRLLKQKVMYILYRFTQCKLIPKKQYHRTLKTKAMFSWLSFHKKVIALTKVVNSQFNPEKLHSVKMHFIQSHFNKWKGEILALKLHEKEQQMYYEALRFRAESLSKKTFRTWHAKMLMS